MPTTTRPYFSPISQPPYKESNAPSLLLPSPYPASKLTHPSPYVRPYVVGPCLPPLRTKELFAKKEGGGRLGLLAVYACCSDKSYDFLRVDILSGGSREGGGANIKKWTPAARAAAKKNGVGVSDHRTGESACIIFFFFFACWLSSFGTARAHKDGSLFISFDQVLLRTNSGLKKIFFPRIVRQTSSSPPTRLWKRDAATDRSPPKSLSR